MSPPPPHVLPTGASAMYRKSFENQRHDNGWDGAVNLFKSHKQDSGRMG